MYVTEKVGLNSAQVTAKKLQHSNEKRHFRQTDLDLNNGNSWKSIRCCGLYPSRLPQLTDLISILSLCVLRESNQEIAGRCREKLKIESQAIRVNVVAVRNSERIEFAIFHRCVLTRRHQLLARVNVFVGAVVV